jgi:hypothetical protein
MQLDKNGVVFGSVPHARTPNGLTGDAAGEEIERDPDGEDNEPASAAEGDTDRSS